MTNTNVIKNKIIQVVKYFRILKRYQKFSRKEIETNEDIRGMVERYLYLLCQSVIDLADSFIAYKKFRQPVSSRESFDILFEEKIIAKQMKEELKNLVGFRNILAHEYTNVNYDIVFEVLQNKIDDTKKFINKINKYITIWI